MRLKRIFLLTLLLSASCYADSQEMEMTQDLLREQGIKVNHWVLAQPNGKPITAMDLAKRLEMTFRQQFPQYAHNRELRYQFFSSQWRPLLNEMINNELMLADAEEKKIEVSDGDVRQELEELFGPHVVATLDEIGLSYDEAIEIVKTNLIVQRIRGFMVTSRAMTSISPDDLQKAFEDYLATHEPTDQWTYQILCLRHESGAIAESASITANSLLTKDVTLKELEAALKKRQEEGLLDQRLVIRLGDVENRPSASLASAYHNTLEQLEIGAYSQPVGQVSRSGSTCYRIFHLLDYSQDDPPTFAEVENELYGQLFQDLAVKEQTAYIEKLRRHYGIDDGYLKEMIPAGFQPFAMY